MACLTFGTDYVGSFLRKGNFTGSDFYFAIKLNPLGLNLDTSHWFEGFGKRGKKVDCYKFWVQIFLDADGDLVHKQNKKSKSFLLVGLIFL